MRLIWKPSSRWLFSSRNGKYTHLAGIILLYICIWKFSTLSLACMINASIVSRCGVNNFVTMKRADGARAAQDFGNPHAGLYFMLWNSTTPRCSTWKPNVKNERIHRCKKNEKRIDEYARRILNAFQAACRYPRIINFTSRMLTARSLFTPALNNVRTGRSYFFFPTKVEF